MTRDDILRMAREARLVPTWLELCPKDEKALERFTALVAAAERERIKAANAPVIENINKHLDEMHAAIRARSQA